MSFLVPYFPILAINMYMQTYKCRWQIQLLLQMSICGCPLWKITNYTSFLKSSSGNVHSSHSLSPSGIDLIFITSYSVFLLATDEPQRTERKDTQLLLCMDTLFLLKLELFLHVCFRHLCFQNLPQPLFPVKVFQCMGYIIQPIILEMLARAHCPFQNHLLMSDTQMPF